MRIGIPKEIRAGERRVAGVPETVKRLVSMGFEVSVEAGAGAVAGYPDADYEQAGARLADRDSVFDCDLLVKVRRPEESELESMRAGGIVVALMESCGEDALVGAMRAKGLKVLAMERIPRISRAQSMDALSSQANIAGYRAAIEAAARFGRFFPMMMTSAGSAKPARVVVLGAGVAGLQAIATARRLGAEVYAYDVRPETREQILSLGAKPIELDLGESGAGDGGYARELSAEAKARQQALLGDQLAKAHAIVTTALIPCRPPPILVTEEVVARMRPGSVIVDLAAANGGNCPLTVPDQVVERHGVVIVGHTNYPSMVAADASAFYGKNLVNLIEIMVNKGNSGPVLKDLDADEITKAMQI